MNRLLWIEDDVLIGVKELSAPVYTAVNFDFDIALNATEGIKYLKSKEYDAVVLDVRLPPGRDQFWIDIYSEYDYNKNRARLGMEILRSLFQQNNSKYKLKVPEWVKVSKFGIMTVENEEAVKKEIDEMGIIHYMNKNAEMPEDSLLKLFKDILERKIV